jgi:DNA-binding transcriptional LysR family regulator
MYRLAMEWFANAGHAPRARIELNYDVAIRSLVAAGYGAAMLPLTPSTDEAWQERVQILPLSPPLMRRLGIAHRDKGAMDGATERVVEALHRFRQR